MNIITGNDDITKTIDDKIHYIEKNYHTFIERRKQINNFFSDFYSNVENYTYEQLIERKKYIESCKEDVGRIFANHFRTISITILTFMLTKTILFLFSSFKEDFKLEDLQTLEEIFLDVKVNIISFILLMFIIILLSYSAVFTGRKYRKYNIIQLEIDIIDSILKTKFKDDECKKNIIDRIKTNNISINEDSCMDAVHGETEESEQNSNET